MTDEEKLEEAQKTLENLKEHDKRERSLLELAAKELGVELPKHSPESTDLMINLIESRLDEKETAEFHRLLSFGNSNTTDVEFRMNDEDLDAFLDKILSREENADIKSMMEGSPSLPSLQ